jgi:hypothetical protein
MKCLVSDPVRFNLSLPVRAGPTVSDETAKIPSNNAMPCCTFALIELILVQKLLQWGRSCLLTSRLMCCAMSLYKSVQMPRAT